MSWADGPDIGWFGVGDVYVVPEGGRGLSRVPRADAATRSGAMPPSGGQLHLITTRGSAMGRLTEPGEPVHAWAAQLAEMEPGESAGRRRGPSLAACLLWLRDAAGERELLPLSLRVLLAIGDADLFALFSATLSGGVGTLAGFPIRQRGVGRRPRPALGRRARPAPLSGAVGERFGEAAGLLPTASASMIWPEAVAARVAACDPDACDDLMAAAKAAHHLAWP